MSFIVLKRALASGRSTGAVNKLLLTGRPASVTVQSRSITDYMRDRSEKSEDNIVDVSILSAVGMFC